MSTAIRLPRRFLEAMIAQARAELPNECCGLLAGRPDGQVTHHFPLVNELASSVEYAAEPRGLFRANKEARNAGVEIVATYHSHPTSPPIPSRKDRERSYGPSVVSFIISLAGETPEVRGWWLTEDEARPAAWEVDDS